MSTDQSVCNGYTSEKNNLNIPAHYKVNNMSMRSFSDVNSQYTQAPSMATSLVPIYQELRDLKAQSVYHDHGAPADDEKEEYQETWLCKLCGVDNVLPHECAVMALKCWYCKATDDKIVTTNEDLSADVENIEIAHHQTMTLLTEQKTTTFDALDVIQDEVNVVMRSIKNAEKISRDIENYIQQKRQQQDDLYRQRSPLDDKFGRLLHEIDVAERRYQLKCRTVMQKAEHKAYGFLNTRCVSRNKWHKSPTKQIHNNSAFSHRMLL